MGFQWDLIHTDNPCRFQSKTYRHVLQWIMKTTCVWFVCLCVRVCNTQQAQNHGVCVCVHSIHNELRLIQYQRVKDNQTTIHELWRVNLLTVTPLTAWDRSENMSGAIIPGGRRDIVPLATFPVVPLQPSVPRTSFCMHAMRQIQLEVFFYHDLFIPWVNLRGYNIYKPVCYIKCWSFILFATVLQALLKFG